MARNEELLRRMTLWRNASKPMLHAIANSLSNIVPNDIRLSGQADDLICNLLEVMDDYIYKYVDGAEKKDSADENNN